MIFDRWDVALARFPFVEDMRGKGRPIAVLSASAFQESQGLLVAIMITSASEGRWASDHGIVDLASAGVTRSCVIRLKIATLSLTLVSRRLGSLARVDRTAVRRQLGLILPLGDGSEIS